MLGIKKGYEENLYSPIMSLQLIIISLLSFLKTIQVETVTCEVMYSFVYGSDLDHKYETSYHLPHYNYSS